MLSLLDRTIHRATRFNPWTNVYGLARTLIAGASALTLLCTPLSHLFLPAAPGALQCAGPSAAGVFCLAGEPHRDLARWFCVAVLLLVASGWRPRYTALLHWWVAVSIPLDASLVDGGDQVASILSFLLLPIALTDPRTWHWSAPPSNAGGSARPYASLVSTFAWFLLRLQVAGIYFHAAVGKAAHREWGDGTAMYYWMSDSAFGAAPWARWFVHPMLLNAYAVTGLSWATIIVEFALCASLFAPQRRWRAALYAGLALHGGIFALQGLASFATIMFAALVLFLCPLGTPFRFDFSRFVVTTFQRRHVHAHPASV